ncbi:hypothetical protein RND81_05G009800 [Saponaria officinalis]|uniref:Peptidase A1 domain-containing protein n=1 Tax=Saponaria officinalis TaxID=3572 RepID=A0AAW1KSR3_SAPOF
MASCPNCTLSLPGSCDKRCFYDQAYGSGKTSGKALFENLNLPGEVVREFFIGCSLNTVGFAQGIAGFGRMPMSLPSQLALTKFSYCLVTHKFDDTAKSSKLILGDSGDVQGITYTPLLNNPPMIPFNQYYYVHIDQITIGGKIVDVPSNLLLPDNIGNGGTIVDSGSTFTFIVSTVFDPIATAFMNQIPPDKMNRVSLNQTSLGNVLCVNVMGDPTFSFPEIIFKFKGDGQMDLPMANYLDAGQDNFCLPFANSTMQIGPGGSGPAIIIGNYQQQNFHIEYDLENERLGFKRQNCQGT